MTDFLDDKRREITDRLKELKPMVDEYTRLEAAASAPRHCGRPAARRVGVEWAARGLRRLKES